MGDIVCLDTVEVDKHLKHLKSASFDVNKKFMRQAVWREINFEIQLIPTLTDPPLTDFKGPTILICCRRISVIANKENKEKYFKGA